MNVTEQQILNDIRNKTGLDFRKIGGIKNRDFDVARVVLPVLSYWVDYIETSALRDAVFACFHTEFARSFEKQILAWWRVETDRAAKHTLVVVLELIVDCRSAPSVWSAYLAMGQPYVRLSLLRKLALCPKLTSQVVPAILDQLRRFRDVSVKDLSAAELTAIGKIKSPEIQEWFQSQLHCDNPVLAKVARRLFLGDARMQAEPLPFTSKSPHGETEIFSTEVNACDLAGLIQQHAASRSFDVPSALLNADLLERLSEKKWAKWTVAAANQMAINIWLRQEDESTIEVWFTE